MIADIIKLASLFNLTSLLFRLKFGIVLTNSVNLKLILNFILNFLISESLLNPFSKLLSGNVSEAYL